MLEIVISAGATMLCTVMVAMGSWVGAKIIKHGEIIGRLDERIESLEKTIAKLEESTNGRV